MTIDLDASSVIAARFSIIEAQVSRLKRKLLSNQLLAQLPQALSLDFTRAPWLDRLHKRIGNMCVLQVYTIDFYTPKS